MTNRQIRWAAQHDWFLRADDNGVFCYEGETNQTIHFTNITKLREWAGY